MITEKPIFVFDVESIGLHGEDCARHITAARAEPNLVARAIRERFSPVTSADFDRSINWAKTAGNAVADKILQLRPRPAGAVIKSQARHP